MAESAFYPPRARWYNRFLSRKPVGKITAWVEPLLPGNLSLKECFWSILVPGYAFSLVGLFRFWPIITCAYLLALFGFIVFLGYPFGTALYIFAIVAHASSIIQMTGLLLPDSTFRLRFGVAIGVVFIVLIGIYWPLLDRLDQHWFMPVREGGRVVVINRSVPFNRIQRGEVVAYMLSQTSQPGVYFEGGVGLARVLAVEGDRITFKKDAIEVNGRAASRSPSMPIEGTVLVPQKHWFIWPRYDITMNNGARAAVIRQGLMSVALVSAEQYRGRPYITWFGRRQQLP